jgi:hypothetical protein
MIEASQRADLLLVRGNPTTDITATRDIVAVWKGGVEVNRDAYRAEIQATINVQKTAPAGSESGLVSDFDGGNASAKYGSGWAVSTDQIAHGKSEARMKVVPGDSQGSVGALEVTWTIDGGLPYAWAGVMYSPGPGPMEPANLSGKKQIRFGPKGDGKTYRVMAFAKSKGYAPASHDFVAGADWKEYTILFSVFETDGHDLIGLLSTGGSMAGAFSFEIDDVHVE